MPAAAKGAARAGDGFDALVASYAKPNDDLVKARRVYLDINPDETEQARMVKAAESWRGTAKGKRMSLANWLAFKPCPWLSTEQDNRPSHRWPACVVTRIKAGSDNADYTAKIWFRDRDGATRMQVLNGREYSQFRRRALPTGHPATIHQTICTSSWERVLI
jgi:hypothetical protein